MKFRGFHPEEVSSFLEQIREELEDLLRENATLKEQIHKADAEIQRFWEMRDLLSRTVQDAHQMSEEYKIQARREVDNLIEKTEESVRDLVSEAHDNALQINEKIVDLKMNRKEFYDGMRNVLGQFIAVIEGREVLQKVLLSDEITLAVESGHKMKKAAGVDEPLLSEDQINMIEGQRGEEGGSEAQQH